MVSQDILVTIDEIRDARNVIHGRLHHTPVLSSTQLSRKFGINLKFKAEMFQKTGAFKVRGVLNKLHHMPEVDRSKGAITISAGNHAQAMAWGGAQYGIQSTVVMPANAVQSKIEATRAYGGEVVLTDQGLMDTCLAIQKERDLTLIHPFDDLHIIAGQGTMGIEIIEDVPDVDVVVVGIGGGGMISGVAAAIKALKPETTIIGVEPQTSCAMHQSLEEGRPVTLESNRTVADGLAAPFAGKHTYDHVKAHVDNVVLVSDDEIVDAMLELMEWCKILPEPAAAAPFAALKNKDLGIEDGSTVVCLLSGGNIDRNRLAKMLNNFPSLA